MNNRIKELRKLKKISQKVLVSNLGITQQALSNYEKEKRVPDQETWQALADFFNVSVPYLKGYGYSKEYIYKCLDDAYKENYEIDYDAEPTTPNAFLFARDAINNFCEQNKISIPKDTDLKFWQNNFNFIFKDKSVNRLLTTKDRYSNDDIKEIIINAIYWYGLNPHTKELVNKLSHNS